MKLTATNLGELGVSVPGYDRAAVTAGVVHFGVGGFHRAHQAVFFDRVLEAGDTEWGIIGVGLMPHDEQVSNAARTQDGLYTLTTLAPSGEAETRVIGSILDVIYAPAEPDRVLDVLSAPSTKIVSLTITEGGYGIDEATGEFAPTDPLTVADLDGWATPKSAWGYIATALQRRRAAGTAPFTIVCCDNIQDNGHITQTALTSFVRRQDPELADWIGGHVSFPSSMVDRITPIATAEMRESLRERTGIDDAWPVQAESFLQWVVEDDFPAGRPDLAAVGVQLVDDVAPYERMKLRLLNASHQAMGYLGLLAGFELVDEACSHPGFGRFLLRYMHDEAIPTLGEVPDTDLPEYCAQLMERFASRAVRDTLARQVIDGSDRLPKFLIPVLREQLATGGPIGAMALVLAGWGHYLEQHLEPGAPPLPDRRADELLTLIAEEQAQPGSLLRFEPVFGSLQPIPPRLLDAYLSARQRITDIGALAAVEEVAS